MLQKVVGTDQETVIEDEIVGQIVTETEIGTVIEIVTGIVVTEGGEIDPGVEARIGMIAGTAIEVEKGLEEIETGE